MEKEEKMVMEEAPPDISTYFDGEPAVKEETQDAGEGRYSFLEALQEANLNE